jgi:predicted MFS family arabinose efflux permease
MTHVSDRTAISRARWSTRAQFLNLGFIAGVWGVHIPSVKAHFALDERGVSVALFSMSVGSLLTLTLAGRVVGAIGAQRTSIIAGCLFCAALAGLLFAPAFFLLLPVILVLGAAESVFDVAINAEGTTLEVVSGKAVMSGFHGMFSAGAMLGAAVAAALLRLHISPRTQLLGVGLGVACSVMISARGMLPSHPAADGTQQHFAWPRGQLLLIGTLVLLAMLAEGVMFSWSVLYVSQELHAAQDVAALAYVAFSAATAAMRFAGDAVRARVRERTVLRTGAAVAACAMLLSLLVARPWMAMVGFALVGVGLATLVPILYNAATRVPGVSRAAAIASVSSIGYAGFMIGPPIIGAIAHATSLTLAMGTLIVASALMMLGTRWLPSDPPPA